MPGPLLLYFSYSSLIVYWKFDLFLSDGGVGLLEIVDLEVSLVSVVNEILPVGHQGVDFLLGFGLDLVVKHVEDSELLLNFNNLELHVHGDIFDLADDLKERLQQFN